MNELEEGGMCAPDPAQRKCVIISMSTYLACLQGCNQGTHVFPGPTPARISISCKPQIQLINLSKSFYVQI